MIKITTFFLLLFPFLLQAQLGLHGSYEFAGQANNMRYESAYPVSGFAFGVDYTFRLANNRVEFFPELNYGSHETRNTFTEIIDDNPFIFINHQALNLYLNTNFYIFDFAGDCDCPTWSKDGNFLKKGFFLQLSPGVGYRLTEYTEDNQPLPGRDVRIQETVTVSIGGGAGIDIGLSDYITLTPYIRGRFFPVKNSTTVDDADYHEKIQMNAGLRLGINFTDAYSRNKKMRARREKSRNKKGGKRKY